MNKIHTGLLTMGLLLMSGALQAQKIKQIKNRARSNSESRSSSSSSGGGGSSSSGAGSDFIGSLCTSAFTGCFDSFINGLGSSSSSSSSNDNYSYTPPPKPKPKPKPKKVIPKPIDTMVANKPKPAYIDESIDNYWGYFQLYTSYSFLPNNYQVFRPGARIRFGNDDGLGFAFSYRYNFLMEKVLGEFTSYFTHDIQLLQVAQMVGKHTEIRIGGGLMIDEFEEIYPEILLGFNSLVDKTNWNIGTELRIAPNYASGSPALARIEWGTNVQYALVNRPKFKLYGGVRSKVANYFGVNIWSVGLGVNMRVY